MSSKVSILPTQNGNQIFGLNFYKCLILNLLFVKSFITVHKNILPVSDVIRFMHMTQG